MRLSVMPGWTPNPISKVLIDKSRDELSLLLQPTAHCSRIDINKILFPGTFFTFPHSYMKNM